MTDAVAAEREIDVVVEVGKLDTTAYDFTISYSGPPALIEDTVPAEWSVFDLTPPALVVDRDLAGQILSSQRITSGAGDPLDCTTSSCRTSRKPRRVPTTV